ncbi:pilus assembly protein [Marinicauda algicola]|uniref:Pilus assembly protein n=1 Tax=Marinicauda algicola TaxID=2029849 RepID=A0A4S2H1H7_9PROT|nr:TadE/TadG family type IV pilus assembly protein [Marinicauda algicola]TGY89032.1 pilus assembly protein [Marinicauda algicola]
MKTVLAFLAERRANAAIEFALIAPVLAAMLIGLVDFGRMTFERSDMLAAARSGSQYFMAGGTDTARAQTIIESAWTHMPASAVVNVHRLCECAGAAAQCYQPCADGSVPVSYAVIELSAELDGVFVDYSNAASDKVRIR